MIILFLERVAEPKKYSSGSCKLYDKLNLPVINQPDSASCTCPTCLFKLYTSWWNKHFWTIWTMYHYLGDMSLAWITSLGMSCMNFENGSFHRGVGTCPVLLHIATYYIWYLPVTPIQCQLLSGTIRLISLGHASMHDGGLWSLVGSDVRR